MHRHLSARAGHEPATLMTGGAGWKVSPVLDIPHELVETLIFDGLLVLQSQRIEFWNDKKS
jgi:type III pantothenate kinase